MEYKHDIEPLEKIDVDELDHIIYITRTFIIEQQKIDGCKTIDKQIRYNLLSLAHSLKKSIAGFKRTASTAIMEIEDSPTASSYIGNYYGRDEGLIALAGIYELIEGRFCGTLSEAYEKVVFKIKNAKLIKNDYDRQKAQNNHSKAGKSDRGAKKSDGIKALIRHYIGQGYKEPNTLWVRIKMNHTGPEMAFCTDAYSVYWKKDISNKEDKINKDDDIKEVIASEIRRGHEITQSGVEIRDDIYSDFWSDVSKKPNTRGKSNNDGLIVQRANSTGKMKEIQYTTFRNIFYEEKKKPSR